MKKILLLAILSVNICLPGPVDFIVDTCKAQSDIAKVNLHATWEGAKIAGLLLYTIIDLGSHYQQGKHFHWGLQ